LRSIGTCFNYQKPGICATGVAPGGGSCMSEVPSGSVSSARWKRCSGISRECVAPGGRLGVRQAVTMQQNSWMALGA